ncbi:unnamed protein product [Citrullus colocynthis]|uniref:Uncharacterized protein n=1 Tax=Citrullus colocynthis TaxID=252529 RepID=A0ABP0XLP8_9ROSI
MSYISLMSPPRYGICQPIHRALQPQIPCTASCAAHTIRSIARAPRMLHTSPVYHCTLLLRSSCLYRQIYVAPLLPQSAAALRLAQRHLNHAILAPICIVMHSFNLCLLAATGERNSSLNYVPNKFTKFNQQ